MFGFFEKTKTEIEKGKAEGFLHIYLVNMANASFSDISEERIKRYISNLIDDLYLDSGHLFDGTTNIPRINSYIIAMSALIFALDTKFGFDYAQEIEGIIKMAIVKMAIDLEDDFKLKNELNQSDVNYYQIIMENYNKKYK